MEKNVEDRASISNNTLEMEKKPTKRTKTSMANEAYEIMKTLTNKKVERDEYQIYGEHIACKIRKLSTDYAKSTVQHLMNNILYEAELGKYNHPPHHYEYSLNLLRPDQTSPNLQTAKRTSENVYVSNDTLSPTSHHSSSVSSSVTRYVEENQESSMDNFLSL